MFWWLLVLRLDEEIIDMLRRAERVKLAWVRQYETVDKTDRELVASHIRNINALRGVEKALHWVLGNADSPLS